MMDYVNFVKRKMELLDISAAKRITDRRLLSNPRYKCENPSRTIDFDMLKV